MTNFWLKLKLWTKGIVFGLIGLYVIVFLSRNWNVRVAGLLDFVFTDFQNPHVLLLMLFTAVVSVIGWWLLRPVVGTIRQFRDLRERGRAARLEKDVAEMKAGKATPSVSPAKDDA